MAGYFPEIYEDELVYSVLARYQRHTGLSTPKVSLQLFGTDLQRPRFDLSARLDHLAAHIAPERGLTTKRLIEEHTLFPYYAALSDPDLARAELRSLEAGVLRPGFAEFTSIVPKPERLRFCQVCNSLALEQNREAFWIRQHQLPAVLVCQKHGCVLQVSTVSTRKPVMRFYVPADETSCPLDAPTAIEPANERQLADLKKLALFEADILRTARFAGGTPEARTEMRRLTWEKGFAKKRAASNREKLEAAVCERFHYLSDVWPRALKQNATSDQWISGALRRGAYRHHPLAWFLIEETLQGIEIETNQDEIWVCLNRLAAHFSQEVANASYTSDHSHTGGRSYIVRCSCGYIYKQTIRQDGSRTRAMSYDGGPILEKYVAEAAANGKSLSQVVRESGASQHAVGRAAAKLGLTSWLPPWARRQFASGNVRRGRQRQKK